MTADEGPPETDEGTTPSGGRIDRYKRKATDLGQAAQETIEHRRHDLLPVDLGVLYYERDRESLATVLGAAIAMRLYLFLVPTVVMFVGLAIAILGKDQFEEGLSEASITGTLAQDISSATTSSRWGGLLLAIVGLWLTAWAGRSLTKVLAANSGRAWRMDPKEAKATFTAMAAITGTTIVMILTSLVLNRFRDHRGFAVYTASWAVTVIVFGLCWFAVTWFLPRATSDPGALLPGAAAYGVAMTVLQWFMQFYLPEKLERSSDLAGEMGMTLAALGYLFFIGRIMSTTFAIDAVVFERLGSLSRFVFALPVIRIIPRRYPSLARFFDLPDAPPKPEPAPEPEDEAAPDPEPETRAADEAASAGEPAPS